MLVKDIMETEVLTLPHTATYADAAKLLFEKQVSGITIVDMNGQMVGVLSEKDLFRVLFPFYGSFYEHPEIYLDKEAREQKLQEIRFHQIGTFMTKNVITIDPDTAVLKAGAIMLAKNIHRLPIVKEKKLVGIVTRRMIYNAIMQQYLVKEEK